MSRFDFSHPGGIWAPEMVPGANDYQHFDQIQSKLVDGVNGGTYAPTKPIIIGGGGLSTTASGSRCTGGVRTQTGGRLVSVDYPAFSPPTRDRTIQIPVVNMDLNVTAGNAGPVPVFDDVHGWGITGGTGGAALIPIPGRSVHIGARLASFGVTFRLTKKPASLPTSNPLALILASSDINGTAPLSSLTAQVNPFPDGNLQHWSTGLVVTLGEYLWSSGTANNSGFYWKVTTAGNVGSTEPNPWPAGPVGTVISAGTATLTCAGVIGAYPWVSATIDSYFASGQPQTLKWTMDGSTGVGGNTNVISIARRYLLVVENIDQANGMVVTGAFVAYDTITNMQFA
jgi:hypothetical protein